MRNRAIPAAAVTVLALCSMAPRVSAASHPLPRRHPTASSETVQVDGIVSRVVDQLWEQDDRYWHHGDYPRIVALDRIIVQADPQFVECYATGGWLMESLGRLTDAEAFYQQAVVNNPADSYARYSLGMFYFNTLKDYPDALYTFSSDVHCPDADVNDWKMLAHSYERTGDLDAAYATWQKIKDRWPTAPAVDMNLNRVKAKVAARGH